MAKQQKIKIERTSVGVRDVLFSVLEKTLDKKMSSQDAMTVCKICAQITNSINSEIEHYKWLVQRKQIADATDTTLVLGSDDE